MANTRIQLHSSGTSTNQPSLGVLANGEIALNFADGIIYYKTDANALGEIKTTTPSGLDTEIQFNDGGDFGGNSYLTFAKSTSVMTFRSDDPGSSAGPEFEFYRNSASPADGDYLGQIKFQGENDAGAKKVYAKVTGKISDASDTTEDGLLEFANMKAGSLNIGARLTSTELKLINGTGLEVAGLTYPTSDGTANQVLVTNGSGTLSFANAAGGGLSDVVDDTTPQLGGNLDLNSNDITGTGNIDITGTVNVTLPLTSDKFTIQNTVGDTVSAPVLDLYRNSSSPADNDNIGRIRISGENSTGSQIQYVNLKGIILDQTNGTEDGKFEMNVRGNGSDLAALTLTPYGNYTDGGTIDSTATRGFVAGGGGLGNAINEIEGDYSFIGGGGSHFIDDPASDSAIVGGYNHTIDGDNCFIGGGHTHSMSSSSANKNAIVGGESHTLNQTHCAIAGGQSHSINGNHGFVGGGQSHTLGNSTHNAVVGGQSNFIANGYSHAGGLGGQSNSIWASRGAGVGGNSNFVTGDGGVVIGGANGYNNYRNGTVVIPGHYNTAIGDGDAQQVYMTLYAETTDATATTPTSENTTTAASDNIPVLGNNSAFYFRVSLIAGVTGAGNTKSWTFEGVIKRGASASTTAFVGTPVKNVIAYDTGASAWDADVSADTTLGALKLTCTGQASTTIRWVAKIETTEMSF